MPNRAQQAKMYLKTKIESASPEELIGILYFLALKDIRQAKNMDFNDPSDYEKMSLVLLHCQNVITELMSSINLQKGGELAANLYRTYEYVNWNLIQANIKKDMGMLDVAEETIAGLQDAWEQMIKAKKQEGTHETADTVQSRQI